MHSRRGGIGRRAPKITDVHRYVVVALLEPLPAGTVFPASQWPLHVTLSTNFDVVAEPEAVAAIIAEIAAATHSFTITGGEQALFGSHHSTPVTLVEPREPLARLHAALVAGLRAHGAVFLYPEHLGDGYRPHATMQTRNRPHPAVLATGRRVLLDTLALVDWPQEGGHGSRRVASLAPLTPES